MRPPRRRPSFQPSMHSTPARPFDLDTPLIGLTPVDDWTIRDAVEGVQIFGAIGSGKTSGSGAALARTYLRAGFGGLVMCAKPEERKLWTQYARETGREESLVIISPDHSWRFNFLDYELRRKGSGGGQTENLVNLLTSITEIVEGKQDIGGGDRFWERAMNELLRNAIDLLSLSKGTLSLQAVYDLIVTAPQHPAQIGEEQWRQTSFCAECIREAERKPKTTREQHDFEVAVKYWLKSYANLADRTRTSIVATFTSIADILLHGIAWELFCTDLNIVPEVSYKDAAIIVLDLPIQEYQELGRITQGIFKFMFQRAILRRDADKDPRPVFLWADEAQNFISSFDYQYQAVARSARACTVYMTQNISNYYSALGARGRDEANALLGNFQTKIFHANTDHATNQYAADIISREWITTHNWGMSTNEQGHSASGGGSESVQYKVLPAAFTTLRKGGPANDREVEAIVFQGGRIWQHTGDTHLKVHFTQG